MVIAPGTTRVFLALNLPGPDKHLAGSQALFERGRAALLAALPGAQVEEEGSDALGPWALVACPGDAEAVKRDCVAIEDAAPAHRLLDLDVYRLGGRQVDRRALGLPARPCLVCSEPAACCIRLGRHPSADLQAAATRLLR